MPKAKFDPENFKSPSSHQCYKCNSEIKDINLKYCENCKAIINPNDLKWKRSFIFCICILCLIPLLIAFFLNLIPN